MDDLPYSNFKMYSTLILVFLFWFATIYPKCFCKSKFLLKFLVLHRRSSDIASSIDHPPYNTLKMYSLLTVVFLSWLVTIQPKCLCESHFFVKLLVLCEISSDIASFVEHFVYSNFKLQSDLILFFLFLFATIHTKYLCWRFFFLKFLMLRQRIIDIGSSEEHPSYSIFKKHWSWFFYPDLLLFT